jgi:hypothetical protein
MVRRLTAGGLEGDGFELPVPRAMQARLKAKIVGLGCMPMRSNNGRRFKRNRKFADSPLEAGGKWIRTISTWMISDASFSALGCVAYLMSLQRRRRSSRHWGSSPQTYPGDEARPKMADSPDFLRSMDTDSHRHGRKGHSLSWLQNS